MKIGAVINFCTNEYLFLKPCLKAAHEVAQEVVVSVADHFFDGTPENRRLLEQAYQENPNTQFLEFAFEPDKNFYGKHPVSFWHNWGRVLGFCHLSAEIESVLFLDADEILDSKAFCNWFQTVNHADAERLISYWYFREPIFRAKEWEDGPLLLRRHKLSSLHLMHHLERLGTYFSIEGTKKRKIKGLDGLPMAHHYSWVRSKENMLRKVATWGHRHDISWEQLVEQEFSRPFTGRDFIYGYEFDTVPSLLPNPISFTSLVKNTDNVRFISTREMHKLELLNLF